MTPIIMLSGKAGSGKDTAGAYLAEKYDGVCLALADPMKRFVQDVFEFTDEQLWGPSEVRNRLDGDASANWEGIQENFERFESYIGRAGAPSPELIESVVPRNRTNIGMRSLRTWFLRTLEKMKEGPIAPRLVLQTLGTEWGRKVAPDMWAEYTAKVSKQLLSGRTSYNKITGPYLDENARGASFVIVTDGRFRNELLSVGTLGGPVVRIDRPDADGAAVEAAGVKGHRSESEMNEIPNHFYTDIVKNDGSLKALFVKLDSMMDENFSNTVYELCSSKCCSSPRTAPPRKLT